MLVEARNVLAPLHLKTEAVWPPHLNKSRLALMEALNVFLQTGELPARLFPPDPRNRRLTVILQALDGALDGATHREIAVALFGEEKVSRDWTDPGNHLRDHVRRAIRRGRYLMKEGYLNFLR
ncbi:DUF2285 domain-containing protein [Roseibium algicola]|nr:DUF2285 domain-containing protein [Roseibium aggregatum]